MRELLGTVIKTNVFVIIILVLIWHLALLLIGNFLHKDTSLVAHTLRWDAGWYSEIIENFYKNNLASAAFYPLFPLLVTLVHKLSFELLPIAASGLVVNIIASGFATFGLYKIGYVLFKNSKAALFATLLFLSFPTAFFMHAFYSEAIFCAIAFWAYYFALKRSWARCGILLAILTACRLPALLFVGLCGLEYFRSRDWSFRNIDKNVYWFLLAPLGFIAYGLYLQSVHGNFFGMFSAYQATADWSYQELNPNIFLTIARPFKNTAALLLGRAPLSIGALNYNVMPALSLLALIGSSLHLLIKVKKWGTPLGIFGLAALVLFTINNNVVSLQRYVLPCLGIFLSVTWLFKRNRTFPEAYYLLPLCLFIIQLIIFRLFINGHFAG